MKKLLILSFVCLTSIVLNAQNTSEPFRAYLINNEYDVFLKIDFYKQNITVPGQDLYGELPGYLSKNKNSFCWLVTSVKIEGPTAHLAMINDYGSEDLTASLTIKDDSIYVLRQEDGSTLKVPKNGKWQKLPKTLEFKRR
jgi:hypothetical protein